MTFRGGLRIPFSALDVHFNLSIRTKAPKAVIVGVSPAQSDPLQIKSENIFQSQGFVHQLLESAKNFKENEAKKNLQAELKFLYHSIHSKNQHYLSKLILGQVLAAKLSDKRIFLYEDSSIGERVTTFALINQSQVVILNIIEYTGKEPEFTGSYNTKDANYGLEK